jgi:hypothetical protein
VTDAEKRRRHLLWGLLLDGAALAGIVATGFGLDMWISASFSFGL